MYGARGLYRERLEVCQKRLGVSRDARVAGYRSRIFIHYELGRALSAVGEYEAALRQAMEAETLSAAILDVSSQVMAMNLQSQCLYPLDRWDDLLALDEKVQEIRARNPLERMGSALCFHTALVSAVKSLRGDRERANELREEAYGIMTTIGGPPEQWVRNQRF